MKRLLRQKYFLVSAEVLPPFRRYFLPSARHWRVRGQRRLPHDGNVAEVLPSCAESSRRKYFLPSGGTSFRPPGIGAFAGNDDYHMTATTQGRRKYFLPGTEVLTYLLAEVLLSRAESSRRKYFLPSGGTFLLPPGIGAFAGNDDYHNPHDGNVPKVAGSTSFHPLAGSTSARKYAEVLTYLLAEVLPSRAESSRRKYFHPSGGTSFLPPGIGAFAGNDDYHMTATLRKYFLPARSRLGGSTSFLLEVLPSVRPALALSRATTITT